LRRVVFQQLQPLLDAPRDKVLLQFNQQCVRELAGSVRSRIDLS
jgi:hypothetical protein